MAEQSEIQLEQSDKPVREAAPTSPAPREGADKPVLPRDALIIIPSRNTVLFPGMVLPVAIGRERSVAAAQEAVREQRPLGLLLQRDPEKGEVGPADLYEVGTTARVLRYFTSPDGAHN